MSHIHLVQALCPKRHAIMAVAVQPLEGASDEETVQTAIDGLREMVDAAIRERFINPWCALCQAPRKRWTFEGSRTAFESMDDAMPALHALEAEQQKTREHFERMRQKAQTN